MARRIVQNQAEKNVSFFFNNLQFLFLFVPFGFKDIIIALNASVVWHLSPANRGRIFQQRYNCRSFKK